MAFKDLVKSETAIKAKTDNTNATATKSASESNELEEKSTQEINGEAHQPY